MDRRQWIWGLAAGSVKNREKGLRYGLAATQEHRTRGQNLSGPIEGENYQADIGEFDER